MISFAASSSSCGRPVGVTSPAQPQCDNVPKLSRADLFVFLPIIQPAEPAPLSTTANDPLTRPLAPCSMPNVDHSRLGSTTDPVVTDTVPNRQVPQDTTTAGIQFVALSNDTSHDARQPMPKAQIEDPRGFQSSQIRRRFSQKEQNDSDGTLLIFQMRPSGPDFPFDIEALDCVLRILFDYPEMGKPRDSIR